MTTNQHLSHIRKCNQQLFTSLNFELIEESDWRIVFENTCVRIIFQYDTRHIPFLETIIIASIDNKVEYSIEIIIESLYPEIKFVDLRQSLIGEFGNLKMTDEQAYAIILEKYLYKQLESCNFSWVALVEAKIKEYEKRRNSL